MTHADTFLSPLPLLLAAGLLYAAPAATASLLLLAAVAALGVYARFRLPTSRSASFFHSTLMGHRGSGASDTSGHPENSLAAFEHAVHSGCNGVEFDLLHTRDGHTVVFHDCATGRLLSGESIVVEESTLAELQAKRYLVSGASSSSSSIAGVSTERVPTLDEALHALDALDRERRRRASADDAGVRMMIEIKYSQHVDALVDDVVRGMRRYALFDRAVVGSFDPRALYKARAREPRIVTELLLKTSSASGIARWLRKGYGVRWPLRNVGVLVSRHLLDPLLYLACVTWLPSFLGCGVVGPQALLIVARLFDVRAWVAAGYAVNTWTVNSADDFTTIADTHPSVSITTDRLMGKHVVTRRPPTLVS